MKLYAKRDPRKLEPFYSQHIAAMTAERLDAKHAIAEELAFRDQRIAMLEGANAAANALIGESADEKAELDRRLQEAAPIEAEWTPVSKPPPNDVWVFFWMPKSVLAVSPMPLHVGYRHILPGTNSAYWSTGDATYEERLVTHWRHLFEPPEGQEYP